MKNTNDKKSIIETNTEKDLKISAGASVNIDMSAKNVEIAGGNKDDVKSHYGDKNNEICSEKVSSSVSFCSTSSSSCSSTSSSSTSNGSREKIAETNTEKDSKSCADTSVNIDMSAKNVETAGGNKVNVRSHYGDKNNEVYTDEEVPSSESSFSTSSSSPSSTSSSSSSYDSREIIAETNTEKDSKSCADTSVNIDMSAENVEIAGGNKDNVRSHGDKNNEICTDEEVASSVSSYSTTSSSSTSTSSSSIESDSSLTDDCDDYQRDNNHESSDHNKSDSDMDLVTNDNEVSTTESQNQSTSDIFVSPAKKRKRERDPSK